MNVAAPVITQQEILDALGLEIVKFRLVSIPKGQRIRLELTESAEKPTCSRHLAQFSFVPDSGWLELLISARSDEDGCRRINVKASQGSPLLEVWSIDIEKQFGKAKRALPIKHRSTLLNFDSDEHQYDGATYQLATFRLNSGKAGRTYMLQLITYPLSEAVEK